MNRTTSLRRAAVAALAVTGCLAGRDASAGTTPHGVFAVFPLSRTPPATVYSDASVVGVTLQTIWSQVEPSPGQFVWTALDAEVAAAAAAGRQVALDVVPGAFSPTWLYTQGAARFSYTWTLSWGYPQCSTVSFPLPWDPVYAAAWKTFVAAFARHFAANPAVVMVKFAGVNGPTSELMLPYSTLGHTPPDGLSCGNLPVAPASAWKAAGYLPGKIVTAWGQYVAAFAAGFPKQQLVVQTGAWGFPPIDANGSVIAGSNGDMVLPRTLLSAAAQTLGDRFPLENDSLHSDSNWVPPAGLFPGVPLGYNTAAPVTGDATCRTNDFVAPCNPVTVMSKAIARANAAGAEFLELFPPDVQNPALDTVIAGFGG